GPLAIPSAHGARGRARNRVARRPLAPGVGDVGPLRASSAPPQRFEQTRGGALVRSFFDRDRGLPFDRPRFAGCRGSGAERRVSTTADTFARRPRRRSLRRRRGGLGAAERSDARAKPPRTPAPASAAARPFPESRLF